MQIQYELLKHRQSEYLKAMYKTRGKQRIHGKSLLTGMTKGLIFQLNSQFINRILGGMFEMS